MTDFRNTKAELNKNGGARALIFDIQRNSFVDGPGIRTTVFFKGCNLRCAWCHNPESQACRRELMFYKEKCIGCGKCREVCQSGQKSCTACGACAAVCPVSAREISGVEYTLSELIRECRKGKTTILVTHDAADAEMADCRITFDENRKIKLE